MFAKEKGTEIYGNMLKVIGNNENKILKHHIEEAYKSKELDQSYDKVFVEKLLTKLFTNYDDYFKETMDIEGKLKNLEEFVRFLKEGLGAKE